MTKENLLEFAFLFIIVEEWVLPLHTKQFSWKCSNFLTLVLELPKVLYVQSSFENDALLD